MNGGSQVEGHEGAFEINGFDFDVSALAGGKATFSPLTVDLFLRTGLTALLGDVTTGENIPSIRIEGLTYTGQTLQTVYDLRLGDVVVTKVHDSSGDHDHLTFDYSQVSLTTTPLTDTGTLGTPVTFGWDIVRGIAIDEVSIPDVPTGDSGGGGALTYFLTIDGLNGGSLNKEHPGAFEIDGFDFDVSALAGGKGSDDLLVFSPLTIDLILEFGTDRSAWRCHRRQAHPIDPDRGYRPHTRRDSNGLRSQTWRRRCDKSPRQQRRQ